MQLTRSLLSRLEASATNVAVRLADAMGHRSATAAVAHRRMGSGALVATGPGRYVNRAIGLSLDELSIDEIDDLTRWYRERSLVPAIEVSAWAPRSTLHALAARTFTPAWFAPSWRCPVRPWAPHPPPVLSP